MGIVAPLASFQTVLPALGPRREEKAREWSIGTAGIRCSDRQSLRLWESRPLGRSEWWTFRCCWRRTRRSSNHSALPTAGRLATDRPRVHLVATDLQGLVDTAASLLKRPVLNETGLTGRYRDRFEVRSRGRPGLPWAGDPGDPGLGACVRRATGRDAGRQGVSGERHAVAHIHGSAHWRLAGCHSVVDAPLVERVGGTGRTPSRPKSGEVGANTSAWGEGQSSTVPQSSPAFRGSRPRIQGFCCLLASAVLHALDPAVSALSGMHCPQ